MHRESFAHEGPGLRAPDPALSVHHAAQPGKRTLTEALPPVQAAMPSGAAGAATGASEAGEVGALPSGPRPSLQMLFGRPPGAAAGASAGAPLGGDVRSSVERSFGCDFSAVRVHEGPQAAAVGALAYTQGEDIHFAPGAYRPDSTAGREVLAHELTHVVQQRAGERAVQAIGAAVNGDTSLEAEADRLAARAAAGERVEVRGVASASSGVQRVTGYPTKEGAQRKPTEIPTGARTSGIADTILQNLSNAGADALKHDKDDDGTRDHSTTPTSGYMIGVVELDTGEVYAACSGGKPPAFDKAVRAAGAIPLDCFIPNETAREIIKNNLPNGSTQDDKTGGVVSPKDSWTEHGAPAGACAASKLVWAMLNQHIGKPVEMTEKLFAPYNSPVVKIADHHDHARHYVDGEIVPSCATCQAFIGAVLPHVEKAIDDWREAERVRLEKEAAEQAEREKREAEARESQRLLNEQEARNRERRAEEERQKKQEKQQHKAEDAQQKQLEALEKIAPKVKQLFLKDAKNQDKTGEAATQMKDDVVGWFKDLELTEKVALSHLSNAQTVRERMLEAYAKQFNF